MTPTPSARDRRSAQGATVRPTLPVTQKPEARSPLSFSKEGAGPGVRTPTARVFCRYTANLSPLTAFTLVELLVIMGSLVVLAALLLPVLGRTKEAGRSTACLSNLRQIGIAFQLYCQDNNNRLPVLQNLGATNDPTATNLALPNVVLSNYAGNPEIFRCPSDRQRIFENTGSSYWWNTFLNGQDADHLSIGPIQFDAHNIPLMFDKEAFHKARGANKDVNYLYADGRIQNILVLEGTK